MAYIIGLTDAQLRAAAVPVSGTVAVTGTFWQATQPVSIATTVAVSGPLTDTQLRATAVPVSLASTTITNFPASQAVTGTFFQATQPVSGTVAATKSGAWPVDTAAKGTTAAGSPTSEATDANTQSLHTRITNPSLAVTGTFFQATQPVSLAVAPTTPVTGTFWQATQPVSAASLPLPTGAATEATLAARIPVNGQALAAASVPVVLASNQSAIPVTGTFFQTTQPVSGTVTVNTISGFLTETTFTARVPVLGQALMAASMPVTIASNQSALPVTGTFFQATQPVSGTVTVNTISGFATEATLAARIPVNGQALMAASVPVTIASNQSPLSTSAAQSGTWTVQPGNTANTTPWLVGGTVTANAGTGTFAVSGPLTDTQLRATAVPVSGTFFQATQPVSGPLTDAQLRATSVPVVDTQSGVASTGNSTTTNLAANGVFTGTAEDLGAFSVVFVSVFSSHASAADGLQIQQSHEGTNWDYVDAYTVPAATGKVFSVAVTAKFFRVVYTNGATATTTFRLQTLVSKYAKKYSSVRPQDGRGNDNDFEENLSYLMGYDGVSAWNRLRSNTTTGLAVSLPASTTPATVTAAVNTATTLTLAAPGAGLFHYITSIQITKRYSVVGVANGAGVIITSTNLNSIAWDTEQLASAAGTVACVVDLTPTTPIKSAVANTATTIACPAQLQTIWRINVTYYTGP